MNPVSQRPVKMHLRTQNVRHGRKLISKQNHSIREGYTLLKSRNCNGINTANSRDKPYELYLADCTSINKHFLSVKVHRWFRIWDTFYVLRKCGKNVIVNFSWAFSCLKEGNVFGLWNIHMLKAMKSYESVARSNW